LSFEFDFKKPPSFGQTLNFSGRSQQPKMKKVFIKRQKTELLIPSSKMKCPKSVIFVNNY